VKIAFMYSGQGAQIPGMMEDVCNQYDVSRDIFTKANYALGRDIEYISFHGTEEDLQQTHNTQPCVLAADLAAGAALEAEGIHPDVVTGFSLGEYAALVRARVLNIEDTFKIVQIRADAMQEAVPANKGSMAAIMGVASKIVEELCKTATDAYVIPANYNSPLQTVISGSVKGVNDVVAEAEKRGLTVHTLAVSAPFHCELMKPAAEKIKKEFGKISFHDPCLPIYPNVTGEMVTEGGLIPDLLYKQAMSAVRWQQTLVNMKNNGIDTFIECGPGKTLWGLARHTLTDATVLRVASVGTLMKTLKILRGGTR